MIIMDENNLYHIYDSDINKKIIIAFRLGLLNDRKALDKLLFHTNELDTFRLLLSYQKGLRNQEVQECLRNIRAYYEEYLEYYQNILNKIKILSSELNLSNSLEICNLFTYLLYQGYLSENGYNKFQSKERKNIGGMFFADVATGKGTCLNYSEYLKDLLNTCGYASSCIVNSIYVKERSCTSIEKINISDKGRLKKINMLLSSITRSNNHAFTLIKEEDKYYIFDATNYLILSINDLNAAIINGIGSVKLDIPFSYLLNYTAKEKELLDNIVCQSVTNSLYDEYSLIAYRNIDKLLFEEQESLIKDFYIDAKKDIASLAKIKAISPNKYYK